MESDGLGDNLCRPFANHKLYTLLITTISYTQIVTVNAIIARLFNVLGEY
jgi:hypothetical protein